MSSLLPSNGRRMGRYKDYDRELAFRPLIRTTLMALSESARRLTLPSHSESS